MSRAAAIAHLAALRAHLLMNWGGPAGARNVLEYYSRMGHLIFPSEWTKPLQEALSGFLPLHDSHFLAQGGSSTKISFYHIANAAIERLVLGTPEAEIIEHWEALLSECTGTLVSVVTLLGLHVVSRVEIAPGL